MPQFTTSYIRQLSDDNAEGTTLGQNVLDHISFYNVTPVVQQAHIATVGTTAATSTTPYGFGTITQANAVVTSLNSVVTALQTYGLLASS